MIYVWPVTGHYTMDFDVWLDLFNRLKIVLYIAKNVDR